ncbi:MAG: dipicolinate synthase subunit B [Clostridia bacterium]|nr:dipicolinate synthase subunit B [Clostridia bacterium]MBQ2346889.1 dipicolinate synthase subunit B [Clostridia bacterium]
MEHLTIGYAMCGSYCTFEKSIKQLEKLIEQGYDILPIMSENAYTTDTRFGKCKEFNEKIESICKSRIIHTIKDAEPIGPKKMCDLIIISPCTGNTLAKLTNGITDTAVTMAVKSHLRILRPVLITLATNDALGAAAKNIGYMLNRKNIFFVPMKQDDHEKKPNSLVADFSLIPTAAEFALKYKQIQPVFN